MNIWWNTSKSLSIDHIARLLCVLLTAFGLGNFLGISLKYISNIPGMICLVVIVFEYLNYLAYTTKQINTLQELNFSVKFLKNITQYITLIKQGILLGIFIEAFKVGS